MVLTPAFPLAHGNMKVGVKLTGVSGTGSRMENDNRQLVLSFSTGSSLIHPAALMAFSDLGLRSVFG